MTAIVEDYAPESCWSGKVLPLAPTISFEFSPKEEDGKYSFSTTRNLLEAIVQSAPDDYMYARIGGSCVYYVDKDDPGYRPTALSTIPDERLSPSCLIGQLMSVLGFIPPNEQNGNGISGLRIFTERFTPLAQKFMTLVQSNQDNGMTWRWALRSASDAVHILEAHSQFTD